MVKYVLKAQATRVVNKNDKGIVTYRKRYKRGDVVDVSYIEPAQVEALVAAGHLVLDDGSAAPDAEEEAGATGTPDDAEGQGDAEDEAEAEDFNSYDYPTLQRLAKERTGDGSGGKQDLIDRLTAHAESDDE